MQKFVVKKISRSTNITIAAEENQSFAKCDEYKPQMTGGLEISSVKMSGYLKKKRNRVGGWNKLYFVLQNSLLMSYNSRDEYEKKLVSFKDVICLIPGSTVLLPSLEPRFTIGSNLNTFYTFRCDDNRTCSKWITAILECLSRDISLEGYAEKTHTPTRAFCSQQNLSHHPKPICKSLNHSWENLPNSNWVVNHNGRILLELNCHRAKLPIAAKTAKMLQKCSDSDVIITTTTTKKVNFIPNDENQNSVRNGDHKELRLNGEANERFDRFRLHHADGKVKMQQSNELSRISKMFTQKNERQRPEKSTQSNGNDSIETGIEEQVQAMTFDDETGDYASINAANYQSVDSKMFDHKLNIEGNYAVIDSDNAAFESSNVQLPEYATVDIQKKHETREKKSKATRNNSSAIYEDIQIGEIDNAENNIYELIDLPLRPSQKSRSLVWKNWSRMYLFDFTKRFREGIDEGSSKIPSPETIRKRQKASLTLSDISKRFNYRSMRKKAKKMCSKDSSAVVSASEKPS